QVKTGAYRIDLVVEGEGDARLAGECDGDEFHGPDRWAHDMRRQRVLERAGWTFWRCFASTWTLHKDEVLSELMERLNTMGIAPLGAVECAPMLVEKRTWRPPRAEDASDHIDVALENAIQRPNCLALLGDRGVAMNPGEAAAGNSLSVNMGTRPIRHRR